MNEQRMKKANDLTWDETAVARLDPRARLVYRSNLLGADPRVVNSGGGNTSAKLLERDLLSGDEVEVLWVKGSGGDLRTAGADGFASLYMSRLQALRVRYLKSEHRGAKTAVEDAMVEMYPHCTFGLNPRAASIDTPLHAFIPHRHVDHTHPNAVIAVAAAAAGERLCREIYGDDVAWMPWQRPGFDLGLELGVMCAERPRLKGVLMGQHGLISWADDDRHCYDNTLELIARAERYLAKHDLGERAFGGAKCQPLDEAARRAALAELLPEVRGLISQGKRMIGTIQDDEATLRFVGSVDAARLSELGTSCPDHFLRTKIKPLYVDWNPQRHSLDDLRKLLRVGLERYRCDYADYYQRCKRADSPAMRDANPTVMLIPGVGMISWGKDKSESRVTAEFYSCAIAVMRGAEAIDDYVALPQQEAFDIEYWLLEEAKLKRMPPEKELSRQIIAVVGAGSGIGKEVASRLAQAGAHVVCVDLGADAAAATAGGIVAKLGESIGSGGSGISACGAAIGLGADITRRESVAAALRDCTLAYGGLDGIALTAGYFATPDASGKIADEKWATTFAINVSGQYLVADEANRLWKAQGLPAKLVLTTSANAVVAKKGSLAYDTSKAAANHLVRELAIELAPLVRVNAVAPATVIQGSSMFPRDRVMASLTKYGIAHSADEETDSLIAKLAKFYADRTLTRLPITTADQAEAIVLLLGDKLAKTTGQIIAVDGGLHEAFLR